MRKRTVAVALGRSCISALTLFSIACTESDPNAAAVVHVFGRTGLATGEFSYPRAIAVSPVDGRVFVVDKTARIQRFSPEGEFERRWRMPEYKSGKPVGLYVGPQGRVWVPDTHYSRVIVYDRDGNEQFRFGAHGEGPGQFELPTAVVLDGSGNIFVAEYGDNDRISKFSPTREYLFSFGDRDSGAAALRRPTELRIDDRGVLWVADANNHRICRFDLDGNLLSSFGLAGTGGDRMNYPYGLVLEPGGTILVADQGNNRIVRYDRQGKFLASWGSAGRAIGQTRHPWDVALGRDGQIYALDSWNNRVQVLKW